MVKILIIDDERSIRNTIKEILEYEGYKVDEAVDGEDGLTKALATKYDLVLCDIKMPKKDGMEVLGELYKMSPETAVIMISGHGNIETAVECTKLGAFDFISKPPDLNRLLITVRNALDKTTLIEETKVLKKKITKSTTPQIIGESNAIQQVKDIIAQVAPTDARVLITGENGTGKELVARWLHDMSSRASHLLVEVNCAAIPSELIESELFGHEKGAFTSAVTQRIGKFEQANGGTLFLDEIGDMDVNVQAKVLRALQEHKITRVGGNKDISVDVRVVSATNKDLAKEIENKKFRLDLYHRLNVINIHLPTLNERGDDIKLIAQSFLEQVCDEYKIAHKTFSKAALEQLMGYNYSGNIRELRNMVERLVILSGQEITDADVVKFTNALDLNSSEISPAIINNYTDLESFKRFAARSFLLKKYRDAGSNVHNLAKLLQMDDQQVTNLLVDHKVI